MKPFGWISTVWVLAVILGLVGVSCTTQVTTERRPPGDTETRGRGDTETRGHGDMETVAASTTADAATLGAALSSGPLALSPQPSALLLRMQLVGANRNSQVVGLDELPGKSNYFIGNDPQQWHTNIPTYARVQYKDIYPGIDLVYYGNQRQLEYDFVVAPGADPEVITLAFDGIVGAGPRACPQEGDHRGSPLRIDDNGDLILHAVGGELCLYKPRIYREIGSARRKRSCHIGASRRAV